MSQSGLIWEGHARKGGRTTPREQNAVRNSCSWATHGNAQEPILPEPDLTPGWSSPGLPVPVPILNNPDPGEEEEFLG